MITKIIDMTILVVLVALTGYSAIRQNKVDVGWGVFLLVVFGIVLAVTRNGRSPREKKEKKKDTKKG